tara:strand:+ start:936 stop:1784 length:849 start_codon:yes stop_codon:yes gene_type:complete
MKFKTFVAIYYSHRIKKAKIFRKNYIFLILPFVYLVNKLFFPKIKNLDYYSLKNNYLFTKDLKFLFQFFNSDKGEFFYNQYQKPIKKKKSLITGHYYHLFYEKYFSNKKNDNLNILELGSFKGNATAALFFYFKNANIFSGDIFPDLFTYKSKRIRNFYIDTSVKLQIKKNLIENDINYDFIIEDAGHYLKDQIISLFTLFPKLKPKGIFIIEELDFPDVRNDMNINNEKPTLREILNLIKKNIDFNSKYITAEEKKYFINNFSEINIFKGKYNEIAFIEKK